MTNGYDLKRTCQNQTAQEGPAANAWLSYIFESMFNGSMMHSWVLAFLS